MHDVEHHTVCYLRDLLLTPAHQDPEITSFLSCWVFEEMWHGEAIGQVLEAHGEQAGAPRIAALRERHRRKEAVTTLSTIGSAAFAGKAFIALHMTWGAINEWTTQAGYGRLSERADHPTLSELLGRIMKQEGGHIDFYASEAGRRLAESPRAQKLDAVLPQAHVASGRLRGDAQARSRLLGAITSLTARPAEPWRRASTAGSIGCRGRVTCIFSRRRWQSCRSTRWPRRRTRARGEARRRCRSTQAMRAASTARARSSCARVTCSSG